MLPREGPSSLEIRPDGAQSTNKNYEFINLGHETVRILQRFKPQGFNKVFSSVRSTRFPVIGVGDPLSISIWESGEGRGLFSNGQSKRSDLPEVTVDRAGYISIPYAGRIRAAGRTVLSVQRNIVEALSEKVVLPQAMVSLVNADSQSIIVNGSVGKPGRYPLSLKGTRLLDAIALAGGSRHPTHETFVTFIRNGRRGQQLLKAVVEKQSENVFLQSGDQIYLTQDPRTFTAFGAVAKTGEYKFNASQINILEAVARSGGLADTRADSTGVFVFRYELSEVVKALRDGYEDVSKSKIPVVYALNMADPNAYFFAQEFNVQDKDVVFVSNATGVELKKALDLFNSGIGLGRRVSDF